MALITYLQTKLGCTLLCGIPPPALSVFTTLPARLPKLPRWVANASATPPLYRVKACWCGADSATVSVCVLVPSFAPIAANM